MRIGISYDQGTPKYRLYLGALLACAEQAGYGEEIEPVWLAGAAQPLDRDALEEIDGLMLTGGADVEPDRYGQTNANDASKTFPGRDDAEMTILEAALRRRLPMLAICRGLQLLNVYQGGTLIQDLPYSGHQLPDDERHPVHLEPGSALQRLVNVRDGAVTSSHHQAIDRLGDGLTAVAHHIDGTIEAVEWTTPMRKPWLAAVQWHPERMGLDEPLSGPLLRGFLDAVKTRG